MRCRGLIALLIWGQSVAAADLGTWGDLWPVKEPDMLTVIMQRLTALEQSGEMGRKMDAFKERVIRNSLQPPAVPGIGRTEKYSSRLFDPSVRLAADIVDQGEKLSLKETLTLLDGAARHNVQVLITDSGQRTGTGSALMAMKDAGVNTYRWQGGEQRPATIISEPDRNVRYARLAGDFAASVKAGEESVAQVSGVREQAILTQAIRSELKTQGVLGHPEVTMTALSPVWLDSRSRYLRDMYRPGMVMEQWKPAR
ncbi:hypothetical protein ABFT74_003845 [Escherichia coli]